MKRRRNNDGKFTGTTLGTLTAATQIIKLDGTLHISAGPGGGAIHFCYTLYVTVNYN